MVKVTTTNDQGVTSTTVFDKNKVNFSNTEDVTVEFPVPAKLVKVRVQVDGKLTYMNQSKNKTKTLSSVKDITVNTFNGDEALMWMYLRYTSKGYEIAVLGKNGETKSGMEVSVELTHRFWNKTIYETLETDKGGRVYLKDLTNINKIKATLKSQLGLAELKDEWTIYQGNNYNND